ncbi:hypothetical protein FRC12_011783 [Ceratobasidium sp. 428]|nr:hypothetical protein FRC12_011783 [Ceratobasidium sp. 428]
MYVDFGNIQTLIDSTPGVLGAWDQFGKDYPFLNIQEILESSHGVRSIDTLRRWLRLDDEEKLEAEVTRFESEVIRHGLVLLPGVQRILDQVCTNKSLSETLTNIVEAQGRLYGGATRLDHRNKRLVFLSTLCLQYA